MHLLWVCPVVLYVVYLLLLFVIPAITDSGEGGLMLMACFALFIALPLILAGEIAALILLARRQRPKAAIVAATILNAVPVAYLLLLLLLS